ncbi:nucleotidyltransferase domain-containing protein [Kribbella sp. NPDC026611]|uniref:nucleotidyltransferase domain-containing protein n=1 Tax=Kribbella sp. NPDC026611 TaxID=3154911 RepID=UPI00340D3364
MDLKAPISTVVPSLDGPVLLVLAHADEGLSGRQIHKLAGTGSVAGVRLVLQRLAATGLVHVDDNGNSLLYRLNRKHLVAPIVALLADLRTTLVDRLKDKVGGWEPAPVHASVYGAVARGDGDLDSDVDVLLIRPDELPPGDPQWEAQIAQLMQTVVDLTGNPAHVFELSRTELVGHLDTEDPILNDWAQPSLHLTGLPLADAAKLEVSAAH